MLGHPLLMRKYRWQLFPQITAVKAIAYKKRDYMTRVVFVILVLFQVVGVFYFFFVLKTVKFSFIADLSGPHSKPTEVNIKTLTSVKFESSCTGQ